MHQRSSTMRTEIRYWRRVHNPSIGFFPWGLLGALLLLAAFLWGVTRFARRTIESTVKESVSAVLAREGFPDVDVSVDGQEVTLSGQCAPDCDQAMTLARITRSSSAFGALYSPTVVRGNFTEPTPEAPRPWGNVSATIQSGELILRGEVDSEETRSELVRAAEDRFEAPRFTNVRHLFTIASTPLRPESKALAARVVSTAAACVQGSASVMEGRFSMNCIAPGSDLERLSVEAYSELEGMTFGSIEIVASEAVEECEAAFAELLESETIRFRVGSAELDPASNGLLNSIASSAMNCPGRIRVEGHTDDSGELEANMQLSRDRAASVVGALVERGVRPVRLEPAGYGPTRPRVAVEPSASRRVVSAARAQNRRIEFHVTVESEGVE